jgi:hypothetical protein
MKALKLCSFLLPFLCLSFITACTSVEPRVQLKKADMHDAQDIIKTINDQNNSLPSTFTSKISVNAVINGRALKTGGDIYYISKPETIKVTLTDLIFRSVIAELLFADDLLKIYLPIDKTLYLREKKANMAVTATLEISPDFISQTALGRIPLIPDFSVTKSYVSDEPGDKASLSRIIVLENDLFYESISTKSGFPDKVRILAKTGGDKFEVHYEKPLKEGSAFFYRKISAFSEGTGNKFEVEYNDIKINDPIDKNIFTVSIPQGTKVVK